MIFILLYFAMDECHMLTLVNNLRISMGLRRLYLNTALKRAMQYHTLDMLARRYFAHVNKQGKGVGYRVKQQGFQFLTVGENIYKGYGDAVTVFRAWVKSEEHYRNLVDPDYQLMGLSQYGDIWGQEFGTGKGGINYDPCRATSYTQPRRTYPSIAKPTQPKTRVTYPQRQYPKYAKVYTKPAKQSVRPYVQPFFKPRYSKRRS